MSDTLIDENSKLLFDRYGQSRPGLDNTGNCSYMNASIQSLFACEFFRGHIICQGLDHPDRYYHKYLADLFIDMTIGMDQCYSLSELRDMVSINNPSFHTNSEHDPRYFIRFLFYLLNECPVEGTEPMVTDVFRGLFHVNMMCKNNHIWSSTQEFFVASLFVWKDPEPIKVQKLIKYTNKYKTKSSDVQCDKCGTKDVEVNKTFNYTGDHLILHLRRTDQHEGNVFVEDSIVVLNIKYKLVAFICFHENNSNIRSYNCYTKFGQTWYQIRDSEVTLISNSMPDQKSIKHNAHILFYKKASIVGTFAEIDAELRSMRSPPHPPSPPPAPPSPPHPPTPPKPQPPPGDESLYGYKLSEQRGVGLVNLGNTCYMNAMIQSLFHCNAFRVQILSAQHSGRFHNLLKRLFEQLINTNDDYISADQFRRNFVMVFPYFVAGQQHDSREFLSSLIDTLFDEVNMVRAVAPSNRELQTSDEAWHHFITHTNNSYLVDIFSLQNERRNVCQSCNYSWSNYDHSWLCLIVFPKNVGKSAIDVQTCINNAMQPELIDMYCNGCKRNTKVNRFESISRPPLILILQLQIFSFHPLTYTAIKLNLNLIVNELVEINHEKYSCFASVLHLGGTVNSGHYTAFCKRGNCWHYFDDTSVSLTSTGSMPDQQRLKHSFILFYERLVDRSNH